MLKQTPLNTVHRAAGAKMVDFGGWDMPVSYGSQIEEHLAVRRDAGMFDVSHMLAVDVATKSPNWCVISTLWPGACRIWSMRNRDYSMTSPMNSVHRWLA